MSSKEDLVIQVNTGEQARELLGNPLLSGMILSKKNHICEEFLNTNISQDKLRTELWHKAQGVISFEQELQQLIESGNIAKQSLIEKEENTHNNVHSPFLEY